MKYRPLSGNIDIPLNQQLEDPHLGLNFDYEFAGKKLGEGLTLLIHSWIIDGQGNVFSRKCSYLILRKDAVDCITTHIRTHLISLGVDDMSCRRLIRNFEIDNKKAVAYNELNFKKTAS